MFERLLPRSADNVFRGQKIALWLFGLVVLVKTLQGLMSTVNTVTVATTADGIPLSTYSPGAAATAEALFALLGWSLFVIGSICIVVLLRYRSLVPLGFTLLAVHYLGGRLVLRLHPLLRTGTAGGVYVNIALFALMVIGLVLSLIPRAGIVRGS